MAHALQRHGQNVKRLGIFAVAFGGFQGPLSGPGNVALAPGADAALEQHIGTVAGLLAHHVLNQGFEFIEGFKPCVHAGKRVHTGLGKGLGHKQISAWKSALIRPLYA